MYTTSITFSYNIPKLFTRGFNNIFCDVTYEWNRKTDTFRITHISFSPIALQFLDLEKDGLFLEFLESAVENNIESERENQEERKAEVDEKWSNYQQANNY